MMELKPEIDEKTYLSGTPLNEALFKYGAPDSVQNYIAVRNTRPAPTNTATPTATLLGALTTINDSITSLKAHEDKIKSTQEILYREILDKIKSGALIPYSFPLPRKLADLPIRMPIDMFFSGVINWAHSELSYKNFEFMGIRLIEPIEPKLEKSSIELSIEKNDNQVSSSLKEPLKENSLKEPIKQKPDKSFSELDPELCIDEKKTAEYLGISPRTLQGYRVKGGGPEFLKISHKVVRYKVADLIKWAENKKKKNTSQ